MTTATRPRAAADAGAETNTETALQAWEPKAIEGLLSPHGLTEDKVNLLVPTVAIRQVNPYLVPDLEMVKLSMAEDGGDIYHSNDMKANEYAPTARALSKIANVAGIDVLDSRRIDDGKDPDVVEWRVVIEMALPSGQRVRRSGTKRIDLHQLSQVTDRDGKPRSQAWLNKAREHLIANAETKAFNRAVRAVLSLQGAMPKAAYSKPFAILRWVPNMNDPDVRRRMLDNLLPASTAAYGPDAGAGVTTVHQLDAGASGADVDVSDEEAPDDDQPTEAEYVEVKTNGHATVDKDTGEIVAERDGDGVPDWFDAAGGEQKSPSLVDRLKAAAKAHKDSGAASAEQRDALRAVFAGFDSPEPILAVMRAALGFKGDEIKGITAGQAAAILAVADELGADELRRQWLEAAA